MSVACWLIPFPLESFVKKPAPWTLISCQRPSWAIAPGAITRIPRTAATMNFRIIFPFLSVLDFLHSDKSNLNKHAFVRQPALPTKSCGREIYSVTLPRTDNAVRACETQKAQKRPTNRNVIMKASLRRDSSHTHCRRPDLGREVWSCRSFVKRSFRTPEPIRHSDSISRAISFAHEPLEPLPRQRKFP